jgi:hypothetical protein
MGPEEGHDPSHIGLHTDNSGVINPSASPEDSGLNLVPHEGNDPLLRAPYESAVPSWVCGKTWQGRTDSNRRDKGFGDLSLCRQHSPKMSKTQLKTPA